MNIVISGGLGFPVFSIILFVLIQSFVIVPLWLLASLILVLPWLAQSVEVEGNIFHLRTLLICW